MARKLFIKTYGCQMNVYDSARMADVLEPLGYVPTERVEEADLAILNTCHVREHAAEKVFSELGRLRRERRRRADDGRQGPMIAVAGCVAQAEGEEIRARAPYVDIVVGPQAYHRLPEMLARVARTGRIELDCDFPAQPKFDHLPAPRAQGPSVFLSVQEGCDKFCTFCVVPYTRGAEFSRPASAVLREARRLVDDGALEITLLGQNVNAWHGEGPDGGNWTLGRLARALAEIPGLARIRYTTSHPLDMDAELVSAHREVPQLMPFLHLPVQAGSDRTLEAMNRRHTVDDYLRAVDTLRAARPDLALSSDFIVGFPGESDADFAGTLDLVRRVGFASAYSFKYSRRPGTPAAMLAAQVPEAVKEERLAELQALLREQSAAFNRGFVGRRIEVLIDRPGRHPGQLAGRSPHMQAVHVAAPPEAMNSLRRLRVTAGHANSLSAVLEAEGGGA